MSAFVWSPQVGSVNDPTHDENILSVRGKTHQLDNESHQNNIGSGGKLCRCKSKRVEPWHILPQSISISQIKTLNQDWESRNRIIVNHIKSNQDKSNQIGSSNPKIKSKTPHSVKSKGRNVKCQMSSVKASSKHPCSHSSFVFLKIATSHSFLKSHLSISLLLLKSLIMSS